MKMALTSSRVREYADPQMQKLRSLSTRSSRLCAASRTSLVLGPVQTSVVLWPLLQLLLPRPLDHGSLKICQQHDIRQMVRWSCRGSDPSTNIITRLATATHIMPEVIGRLSRCAEVEEEVVGLMATTADLRMGHLQVRLAYHPQVNSLSQACRRLQRILITL